MNTTPTNWFGLPPHTTDNLIHWSEGETGAKKLAIKYRTYYDLIKEAGFEKELDELMQAAYEEGRSDENEQHAGEEF